MGRRDEEPFTNCLGTSISWVRGENCEQWATSALSTHNQTDCVIRLQSIKHNCFHMARIVNGRGRPRSLANRISRTLLLDYSETLSTGTCHLGHLKANGDFLSVAFWRLVKEKRLYFAIDFSIKIKEDK